MCSPVCCPARVGGGVGCRGAGPGWVVSLCVLGCPCVTVWVGGPLCVEILLCVVGRACVLVPCGWLVWRAPAKGEEQDRLVADPPGRWDTRERFGGYGHIVTPGWLVWRTPTNVVLPVQGLGGGWPPVNPRTRVWADPPET